MVLAYVCPGYSTKISASPSAASVTSTVAGGACAETFCSPLEPQPIRAASSAIGKTPDAVDNFICHTPRVRLLPARTFTPPLCAYYQTVNWTSGFADRIQSKEMGGLEYGRRSALFRDFTHKTGARLPALARRRRMPVR